MINSISQLIIVMTKDITIDIIYTLFPTWMLPSNTVIAREMPIRINANRYISIFLTSLSDSAKPIFYHLI